VKHAISSNLIPQCIQPDAFLGLMLMPLLKPPAVRLMLIQI
jgi:hypothetical protein